ncbi:MAG: GNAT family N-acetyltransferase [Anaerolineaceae bacterium]|nr:GNAT family N-acetyltransferase [Anaerolineaceae bacterium]
MKSIEEIVKTLPSTITDNLGNQYSIDMYYGETNIDLWVLLPPTCIYKRGPGIANLKIWIKNGNDLYLDDIIVFDNALLIPKNFLLRILFRIIGKSRTGNFRRRGLGNHLLHLAIEIAKQLKVDRIYGKMQQLDNSPNLAK